MTSGERVSSSSNGRPPAGSAHQGSTAATGPCAAQQGVGVSKGQWEAEVDPLEFCQGVASGKTPVDKIPESVIDALKKWGVGLAKVTGRDPAIIGIICVEKPTFVNRTAA